jgi:hypothetical protein
VSGLSTATVLDALERHYRKPGTDQDGEIMIREAQAPGSSRRADLVRVGMWASRGTGIDVHEVKVSRSDWLQELADPAKAEAWWPYCNRFWLVALPSVVADGELPAGWGLMEFPASGRRFKVRVAAEARTDVRLTVPLLVELLRRADNARLAEMDRMRTEHRNEMGKLADEWRQRKAEGEMPPATRKRLELLGRVEALTGMKLAEYATWEGRDMTPAELAAFLADAREHVGAQRKEGDAAREIGRLRHAVESARRALAEIEKPA